MDDRIGGFLVAIALALAVSGGVPSFAMAQSATIRNIRPTPHFAPSGTSLSDISAAIKLAANAEMWQVTEDTSGVMTATLHVRTHGAVVTIGFDESNFWIEYRDSYNLDYHQTDLRRLKNARVVKGPRIHRNYNRWVGMLAKSIATHAKNARRSSPIRTMPAVAPSLIADELEKLDTLRSRGVLTQQEFDQQKAKLLGN
jgi:hypothetical protein